MSGTHMRSAADMRSLSHLMAAVHVPRLQKVEAPDPAADTKTPLPEEVNEKHKYLHGWQAFVLCTKCTLYLETGSHIMPTGNSTLYK